MARFVIVPQWQGSPSSRAMQLIDGAQAIAGDLPRASCTTVDIPLEAGESVETGVLRFSTLRRTRELVDLELAPITEPVMLIGGDCGVSVGAVGHAARRHPDLAVVWLDAHPDLHTPESSPSGAFSGMALRAILGDGADGLVLEREAVTRRPARPRRRPRVRTRRGGPTTELGLTRRRSGRPFGPRRARDRGRGHRRDGACTSTSTWTCSIPTAMSGVTASVPFGVSLRRSRRLDLARTGGGAARRLEHHGLRTVIARGCRRRPRHDPEDRRSARVSPIPDPPAGWRDAADRVVGARTTRSTGSCRSWTRGSVTPATCAAPRWAGCGARSGAPVASRGAHGLWVFRGMPRWAFRRGGVCVGGLLPHRRRHRDRPRARPRSRARAQWRRYGFLMPLLYLLAGRDPLRNRFEIEAGLEDGNYVPRRGR